MSVKEKKNAIVTGGTKDQFPAMAVLALNIADKNPNIADELIIFHDGVPLKEQEKINKIFPTRFIEYKSPFINNEEFEDTVKNYFSLMVFCKYECWKLLSEYKTVIWCDYDLIFLKNVNEICLLNNYCCSFIQTPLLVKKFNIKLFWDYQEYAKEIPLFSKAISACLFVLNDSFPNYLDFYQECIKQTITFSKALYLPEEAVISLLFYQKKISYKIIDNNIYALEPQNQTIVESTKGIHSCGQPKFWNGLNNSQWNDYYNIWIKKYNGQKFSTNYKKKIKNIIKLFIPYGLLNFIK